MKSAGLFTEVLMKEGVFPASPPHTAPVQSAAASQSCFTKKPTSGEQVQLLALYLALRPMFPQQGEPMAGYKPAPLGMMQTPADGVRTPGAVLLLLGVSRIKLALKTEGF